MYAPRRWRTSTHRFEFVLSSLFSSKYPDFFPLLSNPINHLPLHRCSTPQFLTPIQLSRYRRRFPSATCPSSSPFSPSLSTSLIQTYLTAIYSALSDSPTSEASLLSEPVVAIVLSAEGDGEGSEKEGRRVLEQLQRASAGMKHEEEDEGRAETLLLAGSTGEESRKGETESEQKVRRMKEVLRSWTVLSEKTDSLVVSQVNEVGR